MELEEAKKIIELYDNETGEIDDYSGYTDEDFIKDAQDIINYAGGPLDQGGIGQKVVDKFFEKQTIAEREKLPLPTFVHIEALPEMPPDLTACSDEEIRKLHSQFHAYQVRTNWLEGIQENKVKVAQHNFKQAYNVEMLKIDAFFREGNRAPKEKTKAYVEAEIMQNKSVLAKKEELLALESDLAELKTLADIYESNVSRLSRESSMRYAERG